MIKKLDLNAKSFLSALLVIFILMCGCYALTFILPGGEYARTLDASGNEIIDTGIPFSFTEGGLAFWKFLLSPFLVLTMSGGATTIAIIIFLLVIGGIFKCLEESKILNYILNKLTHRFASSRYKLLAVLSLLFMSMGTLMGSFEEVIPLVPLMAALCWSLGFDEVTGVAISMLACSCGFATGVTNPFSVGIAHRMAGISMFSGAWYRIIIFAVIYGILMLFILTHAKKNAKEISKIDSFKSDPLMDKATKAFAVTLCVGLVCVMLSCVVTVLQDYTMIIMALMFLVGGILACINVKLPTKNFFKFFGSGSLGIAPSALTVLMASSIKYILYEGKILDTVLYYLINSFSELSKVAIILGIYALFLIMELFISSGSAKAFLLMPLVLPICQVMGISSRLAVLAFAFGDGFSNVLYPTNAGLLISLSLADSSYKDWLKYSWKFFAVNLVVTSLFLVIGLYIGY